MNNIDSLYQWKIEALHQIKLLVRKAILVAAHFNNNGFFSPIPKIGYKNELTEKEIDQMIWQRLVEENKLEEHMDSEEYIELIHKIYGSNMPVFDLKSGLHWNKMFKGFVSGEVKNLKF